MTSANYTSHGAVAVIRLDNPPVNALGASVRKGIAEGLDRAADSDAVTAVILTGAGSNFCGGADVTEFNTPLMLARPIFTICSISSRASRSP
jgi:3-hydroxyacyl-CoA dehydrogenase